MADFEDRTREKAPTLPPVERGPDEPAVAVVCLGDKTWHDGPGWYYYDVEYPDEGSVGAFWHDQAAKHHARQAGYSIEAPIAQTGDEG